MMVSPGFSSACMTLFACARRSEPFACSAPELPSHRQWRVLNDIDVLAAAVVAAAGVSSAYLLVSTAEPWLCITARGQSSQMQSSRGIVLLALALQLNGFCYLEVEVGEGISRIFCSVITLLGVFYGIFGGSSSGLRQWSAAENPE